MTDHTNALHDAETSEEQYYVFPASYAQQRLYFIDQLTPGSSAYNVPTSLRLQGRIDVEALENSFQEIVFRHESLRTIFKVENGEVMQLISPESSFRVQTIDLTSCSLAEREAEALRLKEVETSRPFDLHSGPLLRATLIKLAEEDHILVLVMHHIIADGWSMGVVVREWVACYSAFRAGEIPQLPDMPLQYADFAEWQKEWLESGVMEQQLEYWGGQLSGALPLLQLPTDHPRKGNHTNKAAAQPFALPSHTLEGLTQLGREEGATLFMTLLAAFQVLLHRYTGEEDILVGSPLANRNRKEIEGMIGFFVNTLVLRIDLSGDVSFRELLKRVRKVTLEAYANQDVPFEKIVDKVQPERRADQSPLFQVLFGLENASPRAFELPGLSATLLENVQKEAKFDLNMMLWETPHGVHGSLEYNASLFEATTMARLMEHYATLIAEAVAQPDQPISKLALVNETERLALLQAAQAWQAVDASQGAPQTIHSLTELFAERAATVPDHIAVTSATQSLTYRELDERSNQLAHALQAEGVSEDVMVGLCVERSVEMVISILGILKAGGAYVPLDPTAPPERLQFELLDAQVALVLTQEAVQRKLPDLPAKVLLLDTDAASMAEQSTAPVTSGVTPQHLACVLYTSSAQGKTQGILLTHENISSLIQQTCASFAFDEQDVWTLFHSYTIDFSLWEMFGALLNGGKLVLVPPTAIRSTELFVQLLVREQVTVVTLTPSTFRSLVEIDSNRSPDEQARLSLRYVILGGDLLDLQNLRQWIDRHGDEQPQIVHMYGATETTGFATWRAVSLRDVEAMTEDRIGIALPGVHAYLLDTHLQPVPLGVIGELYIGGSRVARGYHNRPELTAERFIPSPFVGDAGKFLFKTGERARLLPNGEFETFGRVDRQLHLNGVRVELGEIEATLLQHDLVEEAVITVREESRGTKHVSAYIVASAEGLTSRNLRMFLKKSLPDVMIPAAFVLLERLPRTPNGTLDHRALPVPKMARADMYVAPRTTTEQTLADVWARVLNVPEIGIDDNFFKLGGDSILSLQILSEAKQAGLHFDLLELFRYQSIRELVPFVQQVADHATETYEPFTLVSDADRDMLPTGLTDAYPVTRLQEGMVFHNLYNESSSTYQMQYSFHLRAPFEQAAFEQALTFLMQQHPVLRTSFAFESYSVPLQLVHEEVAPPLYVRDLRHLSAEKHEAAHVFMMEHEKHNRFDIGEAPLFRICIDRYTDETYRFYLTLHHAIMDGWSNSLLLTELFRHYITLVHGELLPEAIENTVFQTFVASEQEALSSAEEKEFWQTYLHDVSVTELPRWQTDQEPTGDMHTAEVQLPAELVQSLQSLAHRLQLPLKSVLLAAHTRVLSYVSGQSDVCTGLVMNGRAEEGDSTNAYGLFLNTLPYRLHVQGGTWMELIQAAFATEQELLAHRHYPQAQIQQDQGNHSLYESYFNFTHFHVFKSIESLDEIEVLGADGTGYNSFHFGAEFTQDALSGQLRVLLRWDAGIYDDLIMERVAGYYRHTLKHIATQPESRYEKTTLLSQAEIDEQAAWNDTARDYPLDRPLHHWVEDQVAKSPDHIAVVYEDHALTYRALNEAANRLAHGLQRQGLQPEAVVGVFMERSLEMVVSLLGILKAGGAYLPLDPAYPSDRLTYMIEDANVSVLLTQSHLRDRLPATDAQAICLDQDPFATESNDNPASATTSDSLAYVIYTSGSTGRPKGVMVPQRGVCNRLLWMQDVNPLTEQDHVMQKTPFSFDVSVWEFFWPLMVGARLVMARPGGHQDSLYLVELIEQQSITTLHFVPSMLQVFLEEDLARCQSVRQVMCSGEALPYELVERFYARMGHATLHNLYGPTEASIEVTYWNCPRENDRRIVPIGHPIANISMRILDSHLQAVPVGVPGELHIGGVGVTRGYLNRPDLTVEKFIDDPFAGQKGGRLYKTGDLARFLPNGSIEYLGRLDHQVKIRGFRIELGEIEAVIVDHPLVREAVVTAWKDETHGTSLVAYWVPQEATELTVPALRQYVSDQLPEHMVPAFFIKINRLPLSPNGKTDRKLLPHPNLSEIERVSEYLAPRDSLENALVMLWESLLDRRPIGVRDSFLDIGGHSLLAIRLISQLRHRFDVHISPAELFEHDTIEHLATYMRKTTDHTLQPEANRALVTLQPNGTQRPLFLVHPGNGHAMGYQALAQALGEVRPLYAFQARGLTAGQTPSQDVREMASAYLHELKDVQPKGPYLLAAWSAGATIAYEMALQLHQQGAQVERLVFFDSVAPDRQRMAPTELELLASFAFDLSVGQVDLTELQQLQEPLQQQMQNEGALPIGFLHQLAIEKGWLPMDVDVDLFARLYQTFASIQQAVLAYEPVTAPVTISLLRAEDRLVEDESYGWQAWTEQQVDVHVLPGNHYSLLRPPHVEQLADTLRDLLSHAEGLLPTKH